jgi:TetR/AcrR family fatty acid metabolism transcriptional regulator
MDAALALFARQGFHNTTVPEIVKAADVGHGTFYEYFANKRDVLLSISSQVREARRHTTSTSTSLSDHLRLDIIWFLGDFVSNPELSKVWDEAETFDPDVREERNRLREPRVAQIKRAIELANPPGIDAEIASRALLAMMEEFAQRWFIEEGRGTTPAEVFTTAETLANMWINAIKADGVNLPPRPGRDGTSRSDTAVGEGRSGRRRRSR